LEIFADALKQSHGPCFAGRAALMDWITRCMGQRYGRDGP
jgi:hypothetical protein